MPPCVLFTLSCGLHLPWQEHTSCLSWYVKRNLDLLCIYRCLHTHPDSLAMWLIFFVGFIFCSYSEGSWQEILVTDIRMRDDISCLSSQESNFHFLQPKQRVQQLLRQAWHFHSMNAEAGVANRDQQLSGALVVRWNVGSCPLMLHAEHGLDSSAQQECSQRLFV